MQEEYGSFPLTVQMRIWEGLMLLSKENIKIHQGKYELIQTLSPAWFLTEVSMGSSDFLVGNK